MIGEVGENEIMEEGINQGLAEGADGGRSLTNITTKMLEMRYIVFYGVLRGGRKAVVGVGERRFRGSWGGRGRRGSNAGMPRREGKRKS